MLKKIIMSFICTLVLTLGAYANELSDVQTFFNNFVNASNTYSTTLPDYYVQNAKIIRVVHKPDGTKQSVVIPFERYLQELKKGAALARTVGYKNRYVNQKITKEPVLGELWEKLNSTSEDTYKGELLDFQIDDTAINIFAA